MLQVRVVLEPEKPVMSDDARIFVLCQKDKNFFLILVIPTSPVTSSVVRKTSIDAALKGRAERKTGTMS